MARRARLLWIVTIAYWALLFTATHTPKLPPVATVVSDKLEHVIGYGILATLLNLCLRARDPVRPNIGMIVLLVLMVYGVIDELLQAMPFIHRSCEFLDWCADVTGASIAVVLLWLIATRSASPSPGAPRSPRTRGGWKGGSEGDFD